MHSIGDATRWCCLNLFSLLNSPTQVHYIHQVLQIQLLVLIWNPHKLQHSG